MTIEEIYKISNIEEELDNLFYLFQVFMEDEGSFELTSEEEFELFVDLLKKYINKDN